jgi:hypothetical protein
MADASHTAIGRAWPATGEGVTLRMKEYPASEVTPFHVIATSHFDNYRGRFASLDEAVADAERVGARGPAVEVREMVPGGRGRHRGEYRDGRWLPARPVA